MPFSVFLIFVQNRWFIVMLIRQFEPRDASAVSDVIRTAMRITNSRDYPPAVLNPLMRYFSLEKVLQLALERLCLVAEINEEVIGTISLENGGLETFFVHPDFQARGVGTRLLKAVEEIAARDNIDTIHVLSSLSAVSFYEKMGYRQTGLEQEGTAGRQIGMEKILKA